MNTKEDFYKKFEKVVRKYPHLDNFIFINNEVIIITNVYILTKRKLCVYMVSKLDR